MKKISLTIADSLAAGGVDYAYANRFRNATEEKFFFDHEEKDACASCGGQINIIGLCVADCKNQ